MPTNRMSKTEMIEALASDSGLEKKQVNAVLESLSNLVYRELKADREVTIPGLMKLTTVRKEAVMVWSKPKDP